MNNQDDFLDINRYESINVQPSQECNFCQKPIEEFSNLQTNIGYCRKCELEFFEKLNKPTFQIKKVRNTKPLDIQMGLELISMNVVSEFPTDEVLIDLINEILKDKDSPQRLISQWKGEIEALKKNLTKENELLIKAFEGKIELADGFKNLQNDSIRDTEFNKVNNIKNVDMIDTGKVMMKRIYLTNVGNTIWCKKTKIEWIVNVAKKYRIDWGKDTFLPFEVNPGESISIEYFVPIEDFLRKNLFISNFRQCDKTGSFFGDSINLVFNLKAKYQYDFTFLKEKHAQAFRRFKQEYDLTNVSDYDILASLETAEGNIELALDILLANMS